MSEQESLLSRIGRWFRFGRGNGEAQEPGGELGTIERVDASRSTFLRPWARRDAAIAEGFQALAGLLTSVRDNLESQTQRQDELLQSLRQLSSAMECLPESQKTHSETLKAVVQQLQQQTGQQARLAEIMDKVGDSHAAQHEVLESVRQRVDSLNEHDAAISDNLKSVGSAMQTVSRNSDSATQVLQQLRDNMADRDAQLERILHRQNVRFTTILAVAIFFSVAALVAVVIMGYLIASKS